LENEYGTTEVWTSFSQTYQYFDLIIYHYNIPGQHLITVRRANVKRQGTRHETRHGTTLTHMAPVPVPPAPVHPPLNRERSLPHEQSANCACSRDRHVCALAHAWISVNVRRSSQTLHGLIHKQSVQQMPRQASRFAAHMYEDSRTSAARRRFSRIAQSAAPLQKSPTRRAAPRKRLRSSNRCPVEMANRPLSPKASARDGVARCHAP